MARVLARATEVADAPKHPLYAELADQLLFDIVTGRYPTGSLLPSEATLCRQYGVSRHTVRDALQLLKRRGNVSTHQGLGTRVESDRTERHFSLGQQSMDEVERFGRETQLVDVTAEEIVANDELSRSLPCRSGEAFLHITSYRVPRDPTMPIPKAWTEAFIRAEYKSIVDEISTTATAIYLLIERHFGQRVIRIHQEVSALIIDADLAAKLDVAAGSAGLRMKRTYIGRDGRAVMFGINTYFGSQFSLTMDFSAQAG